MSQRRMILFASLLIIALGIAAFVVLRHSNDTQQATAKVAPKTPGEITYLPLGDSYTIGTSVSESDRWPNQLASKAKSNGANLRILENPSRLGYTSQNLIDRELPLVKQLQPDMVSVLIGVNDYVQGVPADTFHDNLKTILDTLQQQVAQPKNVFLVTIPDYAKTPAGAQYGDATKATAAITAFNQIIAQEGDARGIAVIDIFQISQNVVSDPSLTAADGLHPSGKQYALWTDQIYRELSARSLLPANPR